MNPINTPLGETEVSLTVNGHPVRRRAPVRRLLVDFLREDLQLTGTHVGCEHGICGACTIILNGAAIRSCITLAVQADGGEITTVEGLGPREQPNQLQDAFKKHHALQCGFCTSGILMTLTAADPAEYSSQEKIRELLSGNLCRCTGYQNIVTAVTDAWGRETNDR
jgi:aerobic-type carbon monoxide dehydrogenase small subunit (CoxS/CutS family)